jgi:tetratricopeptide (TPR) repeat protein
MSQELSQIMREVQSGSSEQKAAAAAWNWKGLLAFMMGKVEMARKCYDKAVELDPNNSYGWWGKFWTHFVLGKAVEFQQSADELTDIIPENEHAWSFKGWTHFILGKVDKSLECYEKYIELRNKGCASSSDNGWTLKGYLLHILEKFDDAMKCVDKALDADPNNKYALILKGEILNSLTKHDEAIKCYDTILNESNIPGRDTWRDYVLTLKGNALCSLGKHDGAVICYEKALEHNYYPGIVLVNKTGTLSKNASYAWLKRVTALHHLEIEIILESYDKLLENARNSAYAWYWKGNVLSNLGRYRESIECYDKAILNNPNYALAITNKSNVLSNLDKIDGVLNDHPDLRRYD